MNMLAKECTLTPKRGDMCSGLSGTNHPLSDTLPSLTYQQCCYSILWEKI